jgi:soluble lytic murein transglycosylase
MTLGRSLLVAVVVGGALVLGPSTTSLAGSGHFGEAARAFATGKFKAGLEALPRSKVLDPEGRLLRARLLIKLRRHREARGLLRKLLSELPHMRDLIRFLQGEALFGLKRYHQAARLYRAAARARHSRWIDLAWERRAAALMAARQYRAAAREYEHLLNIYAKHPRRPELALARAVCLMRAKLRRKAGVALQDIWLRWPVSPAAEQAREHLAKLRARRVRVRPPPFWRLIQRARILRRNKRYPKTLEALKELERGRRLTGAEAARIKRERALTLYKSGDVAGALAVLERLLRTHKSDSIRLQLAHCKARLGKLDEAEALLPSVGRRAGPGRIAALRQRAVFLATYGRYDKALVHHDQLVKLLPPARRKRSLATATWLAYRAGEYARAIRGFEELARRSRRLRARYTYWQARAHARAGQPKKAEALYQQVTERHLRTYYGMLARSRLLEAKKVTLPTTTCPPPPAQPAFLGDPKVAELLDKLIARDGRLYPSLRRVRTFWRLGMLADARRELWLIGIDFAWAKARGRPRVFVHRPEAVRVLRGGKPPRRRFGARERAIYKERARLVPLLGELMQRAGIFYFAWRFLPRDKDPVRHAFPQAYSALVTRTAKRFKLDPNLLWAVMKTESSFRTDAVSRAGATGLMQIMPSTGRLLAAEMKLEGYHHSRLYDPEVNVTMAGWYLGAVLKKFKGQITLAAAGYNGGPHNVALWLDQRGKGSDLDEFIEEIPFSESRRYAKKIIRLVALYERVYCGKDDRTLPTRLITSHEAYPYY